MGISLPDYLFIDFESKSEIDLTVRGLDNYSHHSSTKVLLMAYALNKAEPRIWEPHKEPFPAEVSELLEDPWVKKVAFNVSFERHIFKDVLKRDIPIDEWLDVMIWSKHISIPGSLAEVGEILGLDENLAKIADGERLINLFCYPVCEAQEETLFGATKAVFRDWNTDPEDWEKFKSYCLQDVIAERAILRKLMQYPLPDIEQRGWVLDQIINERGVPVDLQLVQNALHIADQAKYALNLRMKKITGLENPGSPKQLMEWAKKQGYQFNSMGKVWIQRAIDGKDVSEDCREVFKMRQQASKTSWAKLEAIQNIVSSDGRVRNQFSFLGSSRAGRWAGRDIQMQNLSRPHPSVEKKLDQAVEWVRAGKYDLIKQEFPNEMDVVSSVIRPAFRAPDGQMFDVADLNAIENRNLGWMTGCEAILDVFRQGKDPYKDFATKMYKIPYEAVTKEQRTIAKPGVLGCFGGNTLVLTENGWKPIISICSSDRVFDGCNFVPHSGIIYQGIKETIDVFGVRSTSDHQIYLGNDKWTTSQQVTQKPILLLNAVNAALEGLEREFSQNSKIKPLWKHLKDWQIDSLRCAGGVKPERAIFEKALLVNSRLDPILLPIVSLFRGMMIHLWKWIESKITNRIKKETYNSLPEAKTIIIGKTMFSLNGMEKELSPKNFGSDIAPATNTLVRSIENYEEDYNLFKSSTNNTQECVFDILNAGPNSRFTILTDIGPLLVHNCGYRLSGGEESTDKWGNPTKTGLWAYAHAMGIPMSREDAHYSVQVFRESFSEVVQAWYNLENVAMDIVMGGQPREVCKMGFEMVRGVLVVHLPSGRNLHYINPRIQSKEFFGKMKPMLVYDGQQIDTKQWGPIFTHGGKILENCLAGDTLVFTNSGLKPLKEITLDNLLWDGVEYIQHGGIISKGSQETIKWIGLEGTKSHKILAGKPWLELGKMEIHTQRDALLLGQNLAPLWYWNQIQEKTPIRDFSVIVAGYLKSLRDRFGAIKFTLALRVPINCATNDWLNKEGTASLPMSNCDNFGYTEEQESLVDATILSARHTQTTAVGESFYFKNGKIALKNGLNMLLHCLIGINRTKTLTALRTTKAMCPEISESSIERPTQTIEETQGKSFIEEKPSATRTSERNIFQRGLKIISCFIWKTGKLLNKLFDGTKKQEVFDIKNAGPRHRFMVLTNKGPVIVHNCDQAISRDILLHGLMLAEKEGIITVAHCHDEIISLRGEKSRLNDLLACMTVVPKWAPGLILGADGFSSQYYRKG